MKLYEITEQYKSLEKLAEEDSELDLADTFEGLAGDFNEKAVSLIKVTQIINSDITKIDEEVKRLTEYKEKKEKKVEGMRDYLKNQMIAASISKIECPLFTVKLRSGRDIVSIDDESKIPLDYKSFKTSESVMKREILAALKNGDEVNGCTMIKSQQTLSKL